MSKDTIIYDANELPKIIETILDNLKDCKIITFTGPLGAGKTTIIREILRNFGIEADVVSPTFTYMNLYKNKSGQIFVHFDLYRIKNLNEFLMAGFDEYLSLPNSLCLIEWPEVIEPLLKIKNQICKITLDYYDKNKRIIRF